MSAWIYRIATHEALRIWERRKVERLSLDDPEAGANALMADEYVDYSDLEAVKLQKAILSLPTKQQLAFNLRYYDELGYDEIAASIALLLVFHPFSPKEETDSFSHVERAFANLSQEDQAYLLAVYQEDIFMNE